MNKYGSYFLSVGSILSILLILFFFLGVLNFLGGLTIIALIALGIFILLIALCFLNLYKDMKITQRILFLMNFLVVLFFFSFIFLFVVGGISNPRKVMELKARTDIINIKNALLVYQKEYGRFPFNSNKTDRVYADTNQARIIKVLTGKDFSENPKKIIYVSSNNIKNDLYLDIWGNPYIICIDGNNDGYISYNGETISSKEGVFITTTVHRISSQELK